MGSNLPLINIMNKMPTPEEFHEKLRADDRIIIEEFDLDPDNPKHGSAQWWVTTDMMPQEDVLDLLPEEGKGAIHGPKITLSLPP